MSDGIALTRYVLSNDTRITNVIPSGRIIPGPVPQTIALPAISIIRIDGFPIRTVGMDYPITFRDRIQITTLAHDYVTPKSMTKLFLSVLNVHAFNVVFDSGLVYCDTILPDIIGPDFYDHDTLIFSQSVDFFVKYRSL